MDSATSYHEIYSSMALYHISSSLIDMGVSVVATDSSITSTLVRFSVPLVLPRNTSHGSVLSQIASLFGCAARSYLIVVAV